MKTKTYRPDMLPKKLTITVTPEDVLHGKKRGSRSLRGGAYWNIDRFWANVRIEGDNRYLVSYVNPTSLTSAIDEFDERWPGSGTFPGTFILTKRSPIK